MTMVCGKAPIDIFPFRTYGDLVSLSLAIFVVCSGLIYGTLDKLCLLFMERVT